VGLGEDWVAVASRLTATPLAIALPRSGRSAQHASVCFRPIADIRSAWEPEGMNDAGDDLKPFRDALWQAQPQWVKVLTLLVSLPA
jgi:hypothetical protein